MLMFVKSSVHHNVCIRSSYPGNSLWQVVNENGDNARRCSRIFDGLNQLQQHLTSSVRRFVNCTVGMSCLQKHALTLWNPLHTTGQEQNSTYKDNNNITLHDITVEIFTVA